VRHKPTFPGQLDHLVAGGQPAGLSLAENLLKECAEEASLTPDIVRLARPVGIVSYLMENEEGLRNDVLFNYDLELPPNVVPANADGEIEEFFQWPLERVIRELSETGNFKFNVAFVIIDFLIRRGFVCPEDRTISTSFAACADRPRRPIDRGPPTSEGYRRLGTREQGFGLMAFPDRAVPS
jgi:hypothetical protein